MTEIGVNFWIRKEVTALGPSAYKWKTLTDGRDVSHLCYVRIGVNPAHRTAEPHEHAKDKFTPDVQYLRHPPADQSSTQYKPTPPENRQCLLTTWLEDLDNGNTPIQQDFNIETVTNCHSTLRTRGETRVPHLWQLIHDARESACHMKKDTLKMLIQIEALLPDPVRCLSVRRDYAQGRITWVRFTTCAPTGYSNTPNTTTDPPTAQGRREPADGLPVGKMPSLNSNDSHCDPIDLNALNDLSEGELTGCSMKQGDLLTSSKISIGRSLTSGRETLYLCKSGVVPIRCPCTEAPPPLLQPLPVHPAFDLGEEEVLVEPIDQTSPAEQPPMELRRQGYNPRTPSNSPPPPRRRRSPSCNRCSTAGMEDVRHALMVQKERKLPKFSGDDPDFSFQDWLEEVERALRAWCVPPEQQGHLIFQHLTGEALEEVKALHSEERDDIKLVLESIPRYRAGPRCYGSVLHSQARGGRERAPIRSRSFTSQHGNCLLVETQHLLTAYFMLHRCEVHLVRCSTMKPCANNHLRKTH
ncbi:hypothetical protein Bbelb_185720 [Branchiostoma belcheri]|nr:hypothetical protein Bbelb_185720 [Branchiostoma belcheri]